MRLVLTGRNNVDITPPLRQQVNRQLTRLERVLNDNAVSAQVVLYRERHLLMTDVTLHARGDNVLSAVGSGSTWALSMKDAVLKVEQQAKRVKEKWTTRRRRGSTAKRSEVVQAGSEPAIDLTVEPGGTGLEDIARPPEPPPNVPRVVRSRYSVRSMSIDEAAERFDGGDEAFVLYRDRITGRLSMIFRRKDGQIGVFEPQG